MNIYIGRDDEKKFDSICSLVQNGFIDKNIIERVDIDNRTIYEANTGNVYIFDANIKSIQTGTGSSLGMGNDGASWFGFFHGKKIDTGKASWTTLIESVAQNYHSRYSFLEFKQKDRGYDEVKVTRQKQLVNNFLNLFFERISYNASIDKINAKVALDDVFCASMKMEIDDGGRQTTPILCKVYFRQRGNELIAIPSIDAEEIDSSVQDIITDYVDEMRESTEKELEENSQVIIRVVNAIDKLINTPEFVKSVMYNSSKDIQDIETLVENGPNIFVKLECKNAKIIGISHVVWRNDVYDVTFNNKKVLRFVFGVKDKMSLYCLNCGNKLLIDSNRISYKKQEEDELIDEEIILSSQSENFGLSDEQIDFIINETEITNHLFEITCSSREMFTNHGCSRICCKSQVLELDGKMKCKDCTIPEIIYRDKNGQVHLTRNMSFARDEMCLVETKVDGAINVHVCEYCNRQFVTMADKYNLYCKFCYDNGVKKVAALSDKQKESGLSLYKQYKGMIPLGTRIMSAFKPKYCFEEVDVILFRIGNDKYILDKLDLEDDGYLKNPRKIKDRR